MLEYDQSGGEVKRIHGAIALRGGMQAAYMAKEGLTGPLPVFEGECGLFASFGGGEAKAEDILRNLGEPWCITQCRYRIYPTIGSSPTPLDIVSDFKREQVIDHCGVAKIRVGMREFPVQHVTTITRPHGVISAQASLGFSLGLLLVKGGNDLDFYLDSALWRDPDVLAIADMLEAYSAPDMPRAVVEPLNRELTAVLTRADTCEWLLRAGMEAVTGPPEPLSDYVKADMARMGTMI